MKKYRKQIYRVTSLLCSIVLIVTLAALPAAASSEFNDGNLINYFDYSSADIAYRLTKSNTSVKFDLPRVAYIRYVDLLIFCNDSYGLTGCTITRGSSTSSLTLLPCGNSVYRLYGQFSGGSSTYTDVVEFNFDFTASSADINFLSFKYSELAVSYTREVASIYAQPSTQTGYVAMSAYNSPVTVHFNNSSMGQYYGWVSLSNWRKYDSMDVLLKIDSGGLSSLYVDNDGSKLPFSASFMDSSHGQVGYIEWDYDSVTDSTEYYFQYDMTYQWVLIHVDLTSLPRTLSSIPTISFTGDISSSTITQGIVLSSVRGFLNSENQTPLAFWFSDLKSFLANIFENNEAAQQAQQTQEQINVEVNAQVSDAVADWDVHITEVQDGYDSGFEGAVPALTWLSSLAEGIFGNMGWFGSIYMLVGLVSVYVLFLNKGGLISRKLK